MKFNRRFPKSVLLLMAIAIPTAGGWTKNSSAGQSPYHLIKKMVLGGEGGWDYFTADPKTHRIFIGRGSYVMVLDPDGNVVGKVDVGKGNDATAVDPVKGVVVGQVPLGGKPETAQTDGQGHIFVNIEDKSELREIDARTLKVIHTWPGTLRTGD